MALKVRGYSALPSYVIYSSYIYNYYIYSSYMYNYYICYIYDYYITTIKSIVIRKHVGIPSPPARYICIKYAEVSIMEIIEEHKMPTNIS